MNDGPHVSVVIPVHNGGPYLLAQLDAVAESIRSLDAEIVVVDNLSDDGSAAMAHAWAKRRGQRLTVAEAAERAGDGYARNVGIRAASAPLLLFCDADDVVDLGWVQGMVAALRTNDVVTGVLEVADTCPEWAKRASFAPLRSMPLTLQGVAYAVGASMAYRRQVHDVVGGWDERFAIGGDDVALSIRAQRAGFRMGLASAAVCRYALRTSLRDALRQQGSYGRGEAQLIAHYAPQLDRGLIMDLGAFCLDAVKIARHSRNLDDLRVGLLHLRFHGARAASLVRFRRQESYRPSGGFLRGRLARSVPVALRSPSMARAVAERSWSQPVVEFTFPPGVPVVGGLGARAPAPIASIYSRPGPSIEPSTLALTQRILPTGGGLLDIGANIGLFSIVALRQVGPSGSVVAIEPNPALGDVLSSNLERHRSPNGAMTVLRAAASAERGFLDLWLPPNGLVGGVAPSPYVDERGRWVTVDALPIDLLGLTDLDVIKIDVEGWEPEVLTGLSQTIKRNPGACLVIELNPSCLARAGHSVDDLVAHPSLEDHELWVIDDDIPQNPDDPRLVPLAACDDQIHALTCDDQWFKNVIAVPRGRIAWFEREIVGTMSAG